MISKAFNRRNLMMAGLAMILAGCQVVPKTGPGTTGPVGPAPDPDASVLPQDDQRHRIALLVPMSGPNANVGQSIANATTMALLDMNADNLRITTYDTATGASSAAAQAIADGNKLILGPLLGDNVTPILAQARPADVPLVSFSNNTAVAASDAFVMGYIPEQSITRTVLYARSQGSQNFAILAPNGEYGRRAEIALASAVRDSGGNYVAVERFDRGNTSIVSAAERLKAKGGYDTILIAEGDRLSILAAEKLRNADGVSPRLLGTELWSGEARVAKSSLLSGAYFSAVSDANFNWFADSYSARFGSQPHRIATLGYDAVLITLKIAKDWKPGRNFPVSRLRDEGGFLGADGAIRFLPTGIADRAMEVRQITNGSISVVSAAPSRFED